MEGTYVQTPYLPASLRGFRRRKHFDVFIHSHSPLPPFPRNATTIPSDLDLKQRITHIPCVKPDPV
jgi:hypothetical protein